jgi:Mg/Co/Ni transporter MgtE
LLDSLEPESAADALEEMQPRGLRALLRDLQPDRAAELLADMEPDEAVDALRELDEQPRAEVFAAMPSELAALLGVLLEYPDDTAGGLMTTRLVVAPEDETVANLRRRLRAERPQNADVDAIVIVDRDGQLIDDIPLIELFLARAQQPIGELVTPVAPVVVGPETPVEEVVDRLIDSRRSSVLVVGDDGRPAGRILSDDVIDALVPERGRRHLPHRAS